eukprot:gene4857-biopygen1617
MPGRLHLVMLLIYAILADLVVSDTLAPTQSCALHSDCDDTDRCSADRCIQQTCTTEVPMTSAPTTVRSLSFGLSQYLLNGGDWGGVHRDMLKVALCEETAELFIAVVLRAAANVETAGLFLCMIITQDSVFSNQTATVTQVVRGVKS